MKKEKWYRFIFADGYFCICRGMSPQELGSERRQHGKLVEKKLEAVF